MVFAHVLSDIKINYVNYSCIWILYFNEKESRSPAFKSFHKVDGEIPEAEQKKCTCS